MQTGTKIIVGAGEGARDAIVDAFVYGGIAVILAGLLLSFAIWWINDRRKKRAEFERDRAELRRLYPVFTRVLEIDGKPARIFSEQTSVQEAA